MSITPLPTAPSRDRPTQFVAEANTFVAALPPMVTEINTVSGQMMSLEASTYSAMAAAQQAAANAAASVNSPSYTGASITTLDLSVGSKTLTVPAGKNWSGGMYLQLWYDAGHLMSGVVTSYSDTTLTMLVTSVTGSGSFSPWQISVLPSVNGLTTEHVAAALGYVPPSPSGSGATGTWPINITGNAQTVTSLNASQIAAALGYTPAATNGGNASGTWPINVAGVSAGAPWTGISGRPTTLSFFANDVGYITPAGRAFPRLADGGELNFSLGGPPAGVVSPTWVWGWTGAANTAYAFNTSNMRVFRAQSAQSADFALGVDWTSVNGRPTGVSAFANDLNYAGQQWVIDNFFNQVAHADVYKDGISWYPRDWYRVYDAWLEDSGGTVRLVRQLAVDPWTAFNGSGTPGG